MELNSKAFERRSVRELERTEMPWLAGAFDTVVNVAMAISQKFTQFLRKIHAGFTDVA